MPPPLLFCPRLLCLLRVFKVQYEFLRLKTQNPIPPARQVSPTQLTPSPNIAFPISVKNVIGSWICRLLWLVSMVVLTIFILLIHAHRCLYIYFSLQFPSSIFYGFYFRDPLPVWLNLFLGYFIFW
jgi:hypothetical protein